MSQDGWAPCQAPLLIPEPAQCLAKMGARKEGVWGEGVTGSEKRIARNQGLGAKDSERGGEEDREKVLKGPRAHVEDKCQEVPVWARTGDHISKQASAEQAAGDTGHPRGQITAAQGAGAELSVLGELTARLPV